MQPFQPDEVSKQLTQWLHRQIYIHLEVNPGAYWRNGTGVLHAVYVKGEGPWRIFLQLDDAAGLIQIDDLTHMSLQAHVVVCIGFDDRQRLARTIEISRTPFPI